jgi:hypothetical protein
VIGFGCRKAGLVKPRIPVHCTHSGRGRARAKVRKQMLPPRLRHPTRRYHRCQRTRTITRVLSLCLCVKHKCLYAYGFVCLSVCLSLSLCVTRASVVIAWYWKWST